MRSTSAPTTSAQVMMAKVSWNMANTDSGTCCAMWLTATCPEAARTSMPENPMRLAPPMKPPSAPPGVNASEYASANHSTLTTAAMPTTLARVLITLMRRTMPP